MIAPQGQTRSEIPDPGGGRPRVLLSSAREVEQGARSMLLLAEGLFRLDVVPYEDTVQASVRNLSPAAYAEARYSEVGGGAQVLGDPSEFAPLSTGRFGGDIVLVEVDGSERSVARFLVGSVCHIDRGVTSFTAQATLT